MAVMELTEANFESMIFDNSIVVVDFWASWCAPCLAFATLYESVSEQYEDVLFTKVNIEHEAALSEAFSIRSVPHLLIFKEGIVIYSESGTLPKSTLLELVEQSKAADVSEIRERLNDDS